MHAQLIQTPIAHDTSERAHDERARQARYMAHA